MKPAQGRRERKKQEARQRLYKAAVHLFLTQGYENTTVQQISDLADTAKATFFNYFPTKEHILSAYHDEMTADILKTLSSKSSGSPTQDILASMNVFAGWAEKTGAIGRILLRVFFTGEVLQSTDQKNEERLRKWFQNQIKKGVQDGELQSTLDIKLFSSLVLAVLSSTVQEWLMSDHAFALRSTLEARILFLLQAGTARQGVVRIVKLKGNK